MDPKAGIGKVQEQVQKRRKGKTSRPRTKKVPQTPAYDQPQPFNPQYDQSSFHRNSNLLASLSKTICPVWTIVGLMI